MSKVLLLTLALCCLVTGCVNTPNKNLVKEEKHEYKLQKLLDSCLKLQPAAMNNEVSRSLLADSIKMKIQGFIGDTLNFLTDLPLEYEMCLPYPEGEKYVVKFGYGEITTNVKLSDEYEATFQIFTIMNKEQVATLVDKALYHVNGVFIDFANCTKETGFTLPSGKCLTHYPSVISIDNKPYFSLGTLILKNATFTPIAKDISQ